MHPSRRIGSAHVRRHPLTRVGAQIAFSIPVPLYVRAARLPHNLLLLGTVPERVREMYGFDWTPLHEATFQAAAGAPYVFAPAEGPQFFERCGWTPEQVHSILKTAHRLKRLPLMFRMFAMLPESSGAQGNRPWSGVCLLRSSL